MNLSDLKQFLDQIIGSRRKKIKKNYKLRPRNHDFQVFFRWFFNTQFAAALRSSCKSGGFLARSVYVSNYPCHIQVSNQTCHRSPIGWFDTVGKPSEIVGNRRKDTLQREAPLDAVPDTGGQYRVYTDGSKPIITRKIIWAYRSSSENCRKPIGNHRKSSETVGNRH